MGKQDCIHLLQEITGKEYVLFTRRGNTSISIAMGLMKELGKERVLIQDQGGWMTYEESIEKNGLGCMVLKTNYGLVNPSDLEYHPDSALLINSMPGYAFTEDMRSIEIVAHHHDVFVVNDATASIGSDAGKVGDLIFGSFGKWKPVNVGEGSFMATDDQKLFSMISSKDAFTPSNEFFIELEKKLKGLDRRTDFLKDKRKEFLTQLEKDNFDVMMPDSDGLNIIVRDKGNESERERIINFCKDKGLEYTLCPRYIRVNESAVSIELKRLEE